MTAQVVLAAYFLSAIAVSVVFAVLAARRAPTKGRRPLIWALLGLLFGVFALLALSRMATLEGHTERRAMR